MPKKRKSKSSQSSPSLIAYLRRLYYHLSRRRRWQLGALLGLMVVTSLAEMVSVGAIFPFLSALGNVEGLLREPWLQPLLAVVQIDTTQRLVLVLALGFIAALGLANGLRLLNLNSQLKLAAAIAADVSSQVYN